MKYLKVFTLSLMVFGEFSIQAGPIWGKATSNQVEVKPDTATMNVEPTISENNNVVKVAAVKSERRILSIGETVVLRLLQLEQAKKHKKNCEGVIAGKQDIIRMYPVVAQQQRAHPTIHQPFRRNHK